MCKKYLRGLSLGLLIGLPGALLALPLVGMAGPLQKELQQTVQEGKQLFMKGSFGGNGRSCNTCHKSGGTTPGALPDGKPIPGLNNAAAIFPRYNARLGVVLSLQDQVHNCVAGALEGRSPAHDSSDMLALISYLTSLSQGRPIDMGGKPE